jgi:hypothetical protein
MGGRVVKPVVTVFLLVCSALVVGGLVWNMWNESRWEKRLDPEGRQRRRLAGERAVEQRARERQEWKDDHR